MDSFSWSKIKKPVVVLAPMADITTLPFRSICKEYGADIVFTPMFSANAIIHNPKKTLRLAGFLPEEAPVIVQIFGYDGELIARAANIVDEQLHPAGIDINMGCPAPKITGNECGSALLRDYKRALAIAQTVRNNYKGQLSVKVRLGWNDPDVKQFVKQLCDIGIDAVTIHGRTSKQGYKGEADWNKIAEIADEVSMPVIGNGDIDNWQIAKERLKTPGVIGIMIGRAALGKPWLFKEIKDQTEYNPTIEEVSQVIAKQARLAVSLYGESVAMRELRKHLGWYLKNYPNIKEIRVEAMQISSETDLNKVLDKFKVAEGPN